MIRKFHLGFFFPSPFHHFVECVWNYMRLFICTQTGTWDLPYWISPLVHQCCTLTASGIRWYMKHHQRANSPPSPQGSESIAQYNIWGKSRCCMRYDCINGIGICRCLNRAETASTADRLRQVLPFETVSNVFLLTFNYKINYLSHSLSGNSEFKKPHFWKMKTAFYGNWHIAACFPGKASRRQNQNLMQYLRFCSPHLPWWI